MIEEIKNTFVNATIEELKAIERFLNQNEDSIAPKGIIDKIFATAHNIKGTAPMLGITNISHIVKPLEKVYAELRCGNLGMTDQIFQHTQKMLPIIMCALSESENDKINSKEVSDTIRFFDSIISENA